MWTRILEVKSSSMAKQGIGDWKLLGSSVESKALQVFLTRSINHYILSLFLPSLGFILIGWFSAWFFVSDDSRRLYVSLISLSGVVFVVSSGKISF
jgi:hypothetical protein